MTTLPAPTAEPVAFLMELSAIADPGPAAQAAGCAVHPLDGAEDRAGLHAAGARALAASLAMGAAPMLLTVAAGDKAEAYQAALTEGLMGYERIHTAQTAAGLVLILILPPSAPNAYWRK